MTETCDDELHDELTAVDLADEELYASGQPEHAWARLRRSSPAGRRRSFHPTRRHPG